MARHEIPPRPLALLTGAGRRAGIAAACVVRLAQDGFDVAWTYWSAYDARMPWGADDQALSALTDAVEQAGRRGYGTVGNLPYGVTKGALDRIVIAAVHELAHLGVTANVVNPGATDKVAGSTASC